MFEPIDKRFNLQAANFGSTNDRVLVISLVGAKLDDEWEQIEGSRILLIGGEPARKELKRLLDSKDNGLGRVRLKEQVPGGMNSRTHTAMRKFCGY